MKTFSQIINTDRRNLNIDIIKALAAFLVCFYHFKLLDLGIFTQGTYIPNLNMIITSICSASVPLFFMLSGIFALRIDKGYKYYFIKSINSLKIYLIWGVLLGVIIESIHQREITFLNIISYIDFLWFLQTLAVLYVFSIIFHKIKYKIYLKIILFFFTYISIHYKFLF